MITCGRALRDQVALNDQLQAEKRKLEFAVSRNKQLVKKMNQEVSEFRMSLSTLEEVNLDIERLCRLENSSSNRKYESDSDRATTHKQKAMEDALPDEKEKCSPTFKHSDTGTTNQTMVVITTNWFNIKHGCIFVTRNDPWDDVFARRSALTTEQRLGKRENKV